MGKRQQHQIAQVLQGRNHLTRDNDRLLVIFGETFNTAEQLAVPD